MPQKLQFSLRRLVLLVTLISVTLALMIALDLEGRFMLSFAGVTFAVSWACLAASGRTVRSVRWCMLAAVSIVSAWLLWHGAYPEMYYMMGSFLTIMLWGGVLTVCLIISVTSLALSEPFAPGIQTKEERAFLVIPLVTTLLLAFQIPLRLGAATAIPTLASKISEKDSGQSVGEIRCGLYTVELPGKRRGRTPEQVYFVLADDSESAFVYSPSGMNCISYNAGNKGHLFGDWYWIKED